MFDFVIFSPPPPPSITTILTPLLVSQVCSIAELSLKYETLYYTFWTTPSHDLASQKDTDEDMYICPQRDTNPRTVDPLHPATTLLDMFLHSAGMFSAASCSQIPSICVLFPQSTQRAKFHACVVQQACKTVLNT